MVKSHNGSRFAPGALESWRERQDRKFRNGVEPDADPLRIVVPDGPASPAKDITVRVLVRHDGSRMILDGRHGETGVLPNGDRIETAKLSDELARRR